MAVYYVWSGATGSANGSSWANAFITLTAAFVTEVAGDTLYVAHDHAESTAGAVTLTSSGIITNPTKVVCVNRAGSVPPVSADRRTTATVTTTGANNITITGATHYDGIIFNCGTGSSSSSSIILSTATSNWLRFDNCSLRLLITGVGVNTIFAAGGSGGSTGGIYTELNNTTMSFANTPATVQICGRFRWRNTPSALIGAAVPDVLMTAASGRGGDVECIGVDFSAAGSGKAICTTNGSPQGVRYRFVDCKLNAAVTKALVTVGSGAHGGVEADFIRSSATGNYAVFSYRVPGTLTEETTIVRAGGASDGTTPISWKVVTTTQATFSVPIECPPIAIWNDTTGSARTATIEGIASAAPNDDEVWIDVEYLGDASSPQGSFVNDGKADLLTAAAAQTTSTATWGGALTGKFKLAVTFTPQQKGWIYARVKCAKPSSTFYIDPLITLT